MFSAFYNKPPPEYVLSGDVDALRPTCSGASFAVLTTSTKVQCMNRACELAWEATLPATAWQVSRAAHAPIEVLVMRMQRTSTA